MARARWNSPTGRAFTSTSLPTRATDPERGGTMSKQVTRRQAEAAARAVAKAYGAEPDYGPKVWDDDGRLVILWEEGPFEWTYSASMGGFDEEMFHNLHPEF